MPEVGVLELSIQDNASKAGRGLKTLATRLDEVKTAASGFSLGTVNQQIKNIVDAATGQKGANAAVKSLGNLLNGVKEFSNIKGITANSAPIQALENIKNAVKGGFNIGMAGTQLKNIREALAGEWNTESATNAQTAIQTIAEGAKALDSSSVTNVSNMASALKDYAEAVRDVKSALDAGGTISDSIANSTQSSDYNAVGQNISEGLKQGIENGMGGVEAASRDVASASINAAKETLDIHSPSGEFESIGEQSMEGFKQGFENKAAEVKEVVVQITEDIVESTREIAGNIENAFTSIDDLGNRQSLIASRSESLAAENERRLEANYESYRDLFLSGEGTWEKDVPNIYGFTPEALRQGNTYAEALKITMEEVNTYLDNFIEKQNTPTGELLRDTIDRANEANLAMKNAEESARVLQNAPDLTESMQSTQASTQSVTTAFGNATSKTTVLTESMEDLDRELKQKKSDMDSVRDSSESMTSSFSQAVFGTDSLGQAFTKLAPSLSSLLKRFSQIAKYRFLRYVLKQITSGVSEGLENVYYYSKAIGSDFADSMDSAATSLNTMKNSIGASLTPVISALIPVLNTVVNWFITLINYVNQFFSLLSGSSTWTRALTVATDAYTDSAQSAADASSSVKDLLADWDELNVIQSESSSGSGSSGGTDTDYSQMFEEVSEYAQWIQDLVDGIEDTFGDVWTLVKQIAALLLTWKVSEIFSGLIGNLLSIAAGIQLGVLEFQVSTMLNNKFLDTGDEGWLVADVLQAAIGGVLMEKILSKVLAGQYAYLGVPIMLSINAAARILTLLKRADVGALSKEAIESNIVSALELGGVAGYLTYTAGASAGQALGGGAAATLITFGVLTNIKATVQAAQTSEVTAETVEAAALGSVLIGAGSAMAAKLLVPGVSAAQTLGFGMANGAAAFLFTMSASLGVSAIVKAAKSGETEASIKQAALSSLILGAGASIVGKMVLGSLASAIGVGAIAAAAAFLTLSVAIAVVASIPKDKIEWGTIDLTDEEVQAFVEQKMFTVDISPTINILSDKVSTSKTKKSDIATKLTKALGTFNVIRLGLAKDEDYSTLKTEILGNEETGETGLIDTIDSYVQEAKDAGKLTLQFTPTLASSETSDATTWFNTYTTGWDKVNQYAKEKGNTIGDMLSKGESEAIINGEKVTLESLMQQITDITSAITKAKINSGAYGNLTLSLGDVTEKGFQDIIDKFSDYKKELTDQYSQWVNEQYELQGQLVAALLTIDPNMEDETTRNAYEAYLEMGKNINKAVDDAVTEAAAPGAKMVAETLSKRYKEAIETGFAKDLEDLGYLAGIKNNAYGLDDMNDLLISWLKPNNVELAKTLEGTGIYAWNVLSDGLKAQIQAAMEAAYGEKETKELISHWERQVTDQVEDAVNNASGVIEKQSGATADDTTINISKSFKVATSEGLVDLIDEDKAAGDVADDIVEAAQTGTKNAGELLGDEGLTVPAKVVIAPYAGDGTDLSFVYDAEVLNDPLQVEVDNVEVSVTDDTISDQLKKEIERAISDNVITIQENNYLNARYKEAYQQALESMGIKLDKNGNVMYGNSGSALPQAIGYVGSAGMTSGVHYTNNSSYNDNNQSSTFQGMTNEEMKANVASGVSQGNASQNSLLLQAVNYLRQIYQKDTTVVIKPSTALGQTVKKSGSSWSTVTGELF